MPQVVASQTHETAQVLALTDSSSEQLLQTLRSQAKRVRWWPWCLAATVIGAWLLFRYNSELRSVSVWVERASYLPVLALSVATPIVAFYDRVRRLTVLFYDMDDAARERFEAVLEGFKALGSSRRLWSISTSVAYADTKYSAGASSGVKRHLTGGTVAGPAFIRANVPVPTLKTPNTMLAFLPDRLLVVRGRDVGAVSYEELEVDTTPTNFVEQESVPSDTKIVDKTWRYVNKKGGPDKRFKDNKELPVVRYDQLRLASPGGLTAYFMTSRPDGTDAFAAALQMMKNTAGSSSVNVAVGDGQPA